jgi:hypothetical protein
MHDCVAVEARLERGSMLPMADILGDLVKMNKSTALVTDVDA